MRLHLLQTASAVSIRLQNPCPPPPQNRSRRPRPHRRRAHGCRLAGPGLRHAHLHAAQGVAIREFPLTTGFADYLLFVDRKAVGALEAKPVGFTLTGVEPQAGKYAHGLPHGLPAPQKPLPFLYLSTGAKTRFVNLLDPKPRTRDIFAIHQPATLAEWLEADTLDGWVKAMHLDGAGVYTSAGAGKPSTLRGRIGTMPNLEGGTLRPNQIEAITALEKSGGKPTAREYWERCSRGRGKEVLRRCSRRLLSGRPRFWMPTQQAFFGRIQDSLLPRASGSHRSGFSMRAGKLESARSRSSLSCGGVPLASIGFWIRAGGGRSAKVKSRCGAESAFWRVSRRGWRFCAAQGGGVAVGLG